MYVGGYCLHCYCEKENPAHEFKEIPHEFTAETGQECRRHARMAGWILRRNGQTVCLKWASLTVRPTQGKQYRGG